MSSRVTGAGLALIAVALLTVSIATPIVLPAQLSLFAGHPTVAGHVREIQDVYVGFYTAQLCNSGGDGTCKSGDATTAFRMAGYAELALTGLLAAITVALALLALRKSEQRKIFAVLVWGVGALALAGAGALILLGPFHGASAPPGIGMALHGAGIGFAMLAGVLARRRPPPIRLRVAERSSQPVAALPTAQARAMRQPPPASPAQWPLPAPPGGGRDPFGEPPAPATPPSDADPGSDPFAPSYHTGDRPQFSASQLRPLYEVPPIQGGTGGLLPIERPTMPARPPAAISRAAVHAATGMPLSLPFGAGEHRPMPRPSVAAPPTAMEPQEVSSLPADEPVAMGVPFAIEDLTPMAPPPAVEELPPAPQTLPPSNPAVRATPPSIPPPLPLQAAAAPPEPPRPAPTGKTGAKPRTQISLVPPMPDNDLPIAPPTAQIAASAGPEPHEPPSSAELTLFPRAETPLAPPPAPPPPPSRAKRESQLPPPLRGKEPTRPPLKAAVPMPERATRSAPSPTRPPPPSAPRIPPPRPALATQVPPIPPIPVIPAIPPIPSLRRPETDVTDPDGRAETSGDGDPATASRAPIEVGDYTSQTDVSVGIPSPEEIDAAVASAGADDTGLDDAAHGHGGAGYVLDTSPSGEPVASAAAVASRPTVAMPEQKPPILPVAVAPPISPVVRDRPMPKLPISTAPDSLPPPKDNKQAIGPSPACPQCEAPMAWVEEHLRFYCKSCRMYF